MCKEDWKGSAISWDALWALAEIADLDEMFMDCPLGVIS